MNLIRGHHCPLVVSPIMGATQLGVMFEEHDISQLYIKAMPYGWRQRYLSQACQTLQTRVEGKTVNTAMGLGMSPTNYLKQLKSVPHTCVQYLDDMGYWTMSSRRQYQLVTSVSKNTRRKKLRTRVPRTTTFGFFTERNRTKTHMTKMWLCFYSTVIAYLPFDRGPVPDQEPTGLLLSLLS